MPWHNSYGEGKPSRDIYRSSYPFTGGELVILPSHESTKLQ
jgi:hypothetical protein